jgi:hypothetical protein
MPLFCDAESTVLLLAAAAAAFVVIITVGQHEKKVNAQTLNTRQYTAPVIVDHPGNLGIIDAGIPNYRDSWNINQVSAMSP